MSAVQITDIHNHLVPAVDDGAQSIEEALRHLTALHAEGVTQLSVSPHLFGWLTEEPGGVALRLDRLEAAFDELQHACDGRADVPRLFFGQEILCPTPLIAQRVFAEPRTGYRGTSYALVEFGFELKGDVTDILRAVLEAGRRIIISHPERYRRERISVRVEELRQWKRAGAQLQINAGSLLGAYGGPIEKLAWQAIGDGLADVIATDHHADSRVVSPRAAFELLEVRASAEIARLLMCENPHRILTNQALLPVPPISVA